MGTELVGAGGGMVAGTGVGVGVGVGVLVGLGVFVGGGGAQPLTKYVEHPPGGPGGLQHSTGP
jgi:hypothetical protein